MKCAVAVCCRNQWVNICAIASKITNNDSITNGWNSLLNQNVSVLETKQLGHSQECFYRCTKWQLGKQMQKMILFQSVA